MKYLYIPTAGITDERLKCGLVGGAVAGILMLDNPDDKEVPELKIPKALARNKSGLSEALIKFYTAVHANFTNSAINQREKFVGTAMFQVTQVTLDLGAAKKFDGGCEAYYDTFHEFNKEVLGNAERVEWHDIPAGIRERLALLFPEPGDMISKATWDSYKGPDGKKTLVELRHFSVLGSFKPFTIPEIDDTDSLKTKEDYSQLCYRRLPMEARSRAKIDPRLKITMMHISNILQGVVYGGLKLPNGLNPIPKKQFDDTVKLVHDWLRSGNTVAGGEGTGSANSEAKAPIMTEEEQFAKMMGR